MNTQLLDLVLSSLKLEGNVYDGVKELLNTLSNDSEKERALLILAGKYEAPSYPNEFQVKQNELVFDAKVVGFDKIKEILHFSICKNKAMLYCTPQFDKSKLSNIIFRKEHSSYLEGDLRANNIDPADVVTRYSRNPKIHTEEVIVQTIEEFETAERELSYICRSIKENGMYLR